eukprot:CAMPEP_0183421120 /NCGR_PEP_ID=MMETSP0370-20130417/26890_1 /TAXON_ID=268820 /ORGANISM="Peridinium aciculiferum, Strain PAER-2" /LENGTH=151 /DNA_ID=CAMNT_0025605067 /DNA_START=78 /DNA_END=531 /DNA_ORIENTATION=-
MAMKYMGAYLMAVIGGKDSPSADDVKAILEAGGIEVEQDMLDRVISKMDGKQAHELIASGHGKFAACGGGGGGGGGGAGAIVSESHPVWTPERTATPGVARGPGRRAGNTAGLVGETAAAAPGGEAEAVEATVEAPTEAITAGAAAAVAAV